MTSRLGLLVCALGNLLLSNAQNTIPSFNGLAKTPPMGFMTWQRFRCEVNCDTTNGHHDRCISEWLIREVADALVDNGWLDLGYEYLVIDDCWQSRQRNSSKYLVEDPDRFPSGMAALGKYVNNKCSTKDTSKCLKFGIYSDYGTYTCGGYPGTISGPDDEPGEIERKDVELFASWGVQYFKLDGCYSNKTQQEIGYPMVSDLLLEVQESMGADIVYSCSYPAYHEGQIHNLDVDYEWLSKICNLWRNYGDIDDDWTSVHAIMNWFAKNQMYLQPYAGPGHWNDPDMLVGGNFGLSYSQNKVQMSAWAMLAAPLLLGNDPRSVNPTDLAIMQNERIIAINQDEAGIQGFRIQCEKVACPEEADNCRCDRHVWMRELSGGRYALTAINFRPYGEPNSITFNLAKNAFIDMKQERYTFSEVFDEEPDKTYDITEDITVWVNVNSCLTWLLVPAEENIPTIEIIEASNPK